MLKKLPRWLVSIAVFLFVVVLSASAVTFSTSYQKCEASNRSYASSEEEHQFRYRVGSFIECESVFANENGDAVTGLATVLLAIITWRLVTLGHEQSETARAELRAYVGARPRGIILHPDRETLSVFVEIINSGETPAFNVITQVTTEVRPKDRFKIPAPKQDDPTLPVLTLAKNIPTVAETKTTLTYPDRLALAARHNERFYVFGGITYEDIFGIHQWVEICAYLEVRPFLEAVSEAEKRLGEKFSLSFKIAEFGNDVSFRPSKRSG